MYNIIHIDIMNTIMYNKISDLIAAWSSGESYTNYHKHKIHYTESGRGYIRKGSLRIYLDEIVMIA